MSAIHHHWLNRGFFYKAAFFLASRLPRQPLYWLAAGIGEVSRLFMRPAREGLETNLARIAGGDRAAITRLSRATFRNYGTYLVDLARFQALSAADVERIFSALEGVEHFDEAVRRGRGIVVVTGHVGNWELGGIFFAKGGFRTHVLTYDEEAPDLKEIKEGFRRGYGIETIVVGESPLSSLPIIRALKEGGLVAMLVDRAQGGGTREVPFLGRPTPFPIGPVVLAGLTGAAIMPAFVVMEGEGVYRGIIPGLVETPQTGDREADLVAALGEIARLFEGVIRRYPDQFYNFVAI
ncbi:MAG: lysophospholipid acyltransferase family protein [Nitrospirae bacterium]|nr:lysophospholipid acyltransferase family protein [Nitrospirota bacterium]